MEYIYKCVEKIVELEGKEEKEIWHWLFGEMDQISLELGDYTYCQVLGGEHTTFLVRSKEKKIARLLAKLYMKEHDIKGKLYLYPNNYKPKSRILFKEGKYY